MTLDEAIYREEALAYSFRERYKRLGEPVGDLPILEQEHKQMAEWLRELKTFHDAMDIIPTTPFDVDLGEIPINNRNYDDIVKCLMIAYERGKNDTLSLIEQYILEGKR